MRKLARDYLRGAESRLKDADSAHQRGDYPEVVRYSQEAAELSLKASLRSVGVEYPKTHDVGSILRIHSSLFPDWFSEQIPELETISTELAEKRAPSMYGVELSGKGPSDIFDRKEAARSLEQAKTVLQNSKKLFEQSVGQVSSSP